MKDSIERILLATDCSDFSAGAEKVAIAMAVKAGAHLAIMSAALKGKGVGSAKAHVDDLAVKAEAEGVHCSTIVRTGADPYEEILAAADEAAADMIVVGRRGKRGLARLMLGDATLKVVGNARCSVMVVPKAAGMWSNRVLLSSDGSASSEAAAALAARIGKCCRTPITVLSVEVPSHPPSRQAEAYEIVRRVVEKLSDDGAEVEAKVERGEPHQVIIDTARNRSADLIVLGSHGRTGLGRLLLGSNSGRVIAQATCPVLVVKGSLV